jgi:hypothetical protein
VPSEIFTTFPSLKEYWVSEQKVLEIKPRILSRITDKTIKHDKIFIIVFSDISDPIHFF